MKEPLLILLVLFVLIGLAYKPIKSGQFTPSWTFSPISSSAIGKGSGSPETRANSSKDIAEDIKKTEAQVNTISSQVDIKAAESRYSPYHDKITLSNVSGLRQDDPSREYIILYTRLDKGEKAGITGWYLKSDITGYYAPIGKASLLPFPFTHNESDIVLERGDRVYLTKGFSPIGISFRTNKCTGYFEEDRAFTPPLSMTCPLPRDENLPQFSSVYDRNDECLDIIDNLDRCSTVSSEYLRDLPDTVSSSCKTYLRERVNYNTCVANHFSDTDFPGNEYRVYLSKFGPLWRERSDSITLYDQNGLVVDTISY